jgi:four helix bundle protein
LREYIQFLYIALSSLAESVSGLHACRKAEQISEPDFVQLDGLAYKLENGLLKLVEALEQKQMDGNWIDHLVIKESNVAHGDT